MAKHLRLVKYEMTVEQEKSFWQKFCCNLYEKTKSVSFKDFRRKKSCNNNLGKSDKSHKFA